LSLSLALSINLLGSPRHNHAVQWSLVDEVQTPCVNTLL